MTDVTWAVHRDSVKIQKVPSMIVKSTVDEEKVSHVKSHKYTYNITQYTYIEYNIYWGNGGFVVTEDFRFESTSTEVL